jgi:hypothetical protein
MNTFQVNLVLLMSLCVLLDIVVQSNGTTLPIPAEMDGEDLGKSEFFFLISMSKIPG